MLSDKEVNLRISIDFKLINLFAVLVAIEVLFLLIDNLVSCCGLVTHNKLRALVDITLEANIPTWFSSTQAIVTGIIALLIGHIRKQQAERKKMTGWYLTGLFFIYLGIDDAAQIHERVSTFINDVVKEGSSNGLISSLVDMFPSYHWQVLFLPVFIIAGVIMLVFIFSELKQNKALPVFIAAIFCYVFAVGLDYIDGRSYYYNVLLGLIPLGLPELEHISRAIEEFFEMLGTTLFMMSFLLVYAPIAVQPIPARD